MNLAREQKLRCAFIHAVATRGEGIVPGSALTRHDAVSFHCRTCGLICGALALGWHNFILFGVVILALLIVMGLGVAIPQLKLFGPFICRGSMRPPRGGADI